MDKKLGLEHTIRNVMSKPLNEENAETKVSLEHAARNVLGDKRVSVETVNEEEQLDEFLKPLGVVVSKVGDEAIEMLGKALKSADDVPVPKKAPVKKPSEKLPFKEPEKPSMPSLPPEAPSNLPVPANPKMPSTPAGPKAPSPSTPAAPKSPGPAAPNAPTAPKAPSPNTPAAPKQAPSTTPNVPKQKPAVKTDTKVSNKTKATIATGAALATAAATKLKDFFKGRGGGNVGGGNGRGGGGGFGAMPGSTPGQPLVVGGNVFGVPDYLHRAGERREDSPFSLKTEQVEPVEIVARTKNSKKTKQAEIIRKIIDEQKAVKKKKSTATVNLNPQLKHQELDQN